MRTLKYIAILGILGILLPSCSESFLELSPISNTNENDFYKTEKDFAAAVTAAYATLYTEYAPQSGVSYCGEQLSDATTRDNAIGDGGMTVPDLLAFKSYDILPSNSVVRQIWNNGFKDLHTINVVIAKLQEATTLNAEARLGYEAEMRFLRALYNFNLVRMFGDIPLLKTPVGVVESYDFLRAPTSEVYEFIVSDLTFAVANLPLQSQLSRVGQASKGAAQGILGKVYLTLGDKAAAKNVLQEIILSQEYELLPDYAYLWDLQHENSREALFEIQHVAGATTPSSPYFEFFAPFENFILTGQGRGMNQPTDFLWNAYEEGDPRRDLSIAQGYTSRSGQWIDIRFPIKWFDDVYPRTGNTWCENNFIVLRYADVLLMYAEAADDAEYLNAVRRRVGLPEYGSADYPSDKYPTLPLAIEHEREVELALEFHRWFDLKRTGRAIPVLSERKGKPITEQMLLLPIPQSERDINPDLVQNPGY
jgi:hypothetical protein